MAKFLPFALPDIGEAEIAEVVDSLRSGWITSGPKARRFEKDFAERLGGDVVAIAVNSATAGLHLAIEALGVGPGDEVITTTHTFTATAEVVRYLSADPVFVDIDLNSYCLDVSSIEERVNSRTKAILPVHYAGLPCDMGAILDIARRRSLQVVEDAAHAFPVYYGDKQVGTLGSDATIFSFYATKTIATGEGGMLVTSRPDVAKRAATMRLHGIDRDAFDRYVSTKPSWYYEVIAPGFKYNMTDIAASLGIHQLKRAEQFWLRRRELAARYDEELARLPLVLPPRGAHPNGHAWHLYVVRLREDCRKSRDEVVQQMFELGVGCSVHYVPLHQQPYWKERYRLRAEDFPNSQLLYERGFSLPIYTKMSNGDQDRGIAGLKAVLA